MFERGPNSAREWVQSRRILLLLGVATYASLFLISYRIWLNPAFGYLGFSYSEPSMDCTLFAWTICLLPCMWSPIDITRPSMLIYWILYLVVYVPTMFVPYMVRLRPPGEISVMLLAFSAGLLLVHWSYRMPLLRIRFHQIPPRLFWLIFALVTIGMLVALLVLFRGKMQFVTLKDLYSQRAESKIILGRSTVIGYFITLLQGMIAPLLMTIGLVRKKYWSYGVGVLIQVLIYGCSASKGALASAIFSLAFWAILELKEKGFGLALTWSLAVFMGLLVIANSGGPTNTTGIIFKLSTVALVRVFGTPGLLAAQYQGFFANHALTHLSHVNGVNWFVLYPYHDPLGVVVGSYYTGNADVNLNANMWLTDGLAAFGTPGILLISVLAGCVFWLLDSVAQGHAVKFSALALTYAALNLANVSLFTTLISGGVLPLMIMFYVMPSNHEDPQTHKMG